MNERRIYLISFIKKCLLYIKKLRIEKNKINENNSEY